LVSSEIEEGATGVALPGAEEGATGASTTASVDAVDAAPRTPDRWPVLGRGVGLTGGIEEEEAMNKLKNEKKIKEKGEISEAGNLGVFSFSLFLDKGKDL
jgi:hypothetical protein